MAMTEEQRDWLEKISERIHAALSSSVELTPNADEVVVLSKDLGQKALEGGSELVSGILAAVDQLLTDLFGEE